MTHETYQLLAAYALGAVTDDERAEVETYLEHHPEHRFELRSLQETAAHLAADCETPAPRALRGSVLEAISQVRPLPPIAPPADAFPTTDDLSTGASAVEAAPVAPVIPLRRRRAWFASAAAAAIIGVGGVALGVHHVDTPVNALTQVSQAADAHTYTLAMPGHAATVTRSSAMGKAVFRSSLIGAAPAGRSYQMWLQQPDGSMVSAGLLPAPQDGVVAMVLHGDAARAVGVGITLEPAGGSSKPTTAPLAVTAF
ncbi:anti-sigma factor [Calidifontibacter terrae]